MEDKAAGSVRGRLEQLRALLRDSALVAQYALDVLVGCRLWEWQWRRALQRAHGNMRLAHELFAEMRR